MYKSKIKKLETQKAILEVEKIFKNNLSQKLNLSQIKGPLFIDPISGLNDDLSGVEHPVSFSYQKQNIEIVQSLAKWKRNALKEFSLKPYEGIFVEMHAIRPDENNLSPYHSLHVDQYDWEKVITTKDRKLDFLFAEVKKIYECLYLTKEKINKLYPTLEFSLSKDIVFISTEDLVKEYPDLNPEAREEKIAKKYGAVFVYGIGHELSDGKYHGARAFDYDDWTINGDIIVWNKQNQTAIELSSMGVRVDEKALMEQAKIVNKHNDFLKYHENIMNKKLPYTIGGGIGRSRINLLMLEKKHIGEVIATYWPKEYRVKLAKEGIKLLA